MFYPKFAVNLQFTHKKKQNKGKIKEKFYVAESSTKNELPTNFCDMPSRFIIPLHTTT